MINYRKNKILESLFYINEKGLVCLEEWRDVVDYEGMYQISNLGRIKSLDRKLISIKKNGGCFYRTLKSKIMGATLERDLYLRINLRKENKELFRFNIHRLVAESFIPNTENKPDVNHKNGVKNDNRLENLEWCTKSENQIHAIKTGLCVSVKGEKHGGSKLTEKDVLEIRSIGKTMTQKEISGLFNVGRPTITEILNRKSWRHI